MKSPANTFKIPRPSTNENLAWKVIEVMQDHADYYQDEEGYRRSIEPATPGQLAIYGPDHKFRNRLQVVKDLGGTTAKVDAAEQFGIA